MHMPDFAYMNPWSVQKLPCAEMFENEKFLIWISSVCKSRAHSWMDVFFGRCVYCLQKARAQ